MSPSPRRALWLVLVSLGAVALLVPRAGSAPVVHVRFHSAGVPPLTEGARPLFGDDSDTLRGSMDAPDLSRWWTVDVDADDVDDAIAAIAAAGAGDVSAEPVLVPAVLAVDRAGSGVADDGPSCPVKTPVYDARQGYRAAVGVDAAWSLPGGRGQGMAFADVEGEWNDKHEDLPGGEIEHVAGRRQRSEVWRQHGTAVLGVVAARDNSAGMLGLAPDVERIVTSSLGGIGPARAVYEAAKRLNAGDVLILELHGPGPRSDGRGQKGYVPMEYWQPEFDAIRFATNKGVIVVEAGGNGGEDLDAPVYQGRFDRRVRDSGAILVGAGAPPGVDVPERGRLAFSNYGARVDVQGWGLHVATLDYGDLQGCSQPSRKYTALFAGTSSASPVVAGAVLAIQGAVKRAKGAPLSPADMRALLVTTGTPEAAPTHVIGPLPHVGRALTAAGIRP